MTLAELDRWTIERRWGLRRVGLLRGFLREVAIVYADRDLCHLWASVTQNRRLAGHPISCADAWIAATAVMLEAPLLTSTVTDFYGIQGLEILGEKEK